MLVPCLAATTRRVVCQIVSPANAQMVSASALVLLCVSSNAWNIAAQEETGYWANSHQVIEEELDFASSTGNASQVRFLLMTGIAGIRANIDQQPVKYSLFTPLMRAADQGHALLVEIFVKAGADLNLCNHGGETALMRAAANGHAKEVKLLLDGGAASELQAKSGFNALRMAAARGHDKVARYLVQGGALVDARDMQGRTALMYAAEVG
jgi:ankyrin repeat protein